MAGDQQADSERLGFDAAVEPRLAGEKGIGTRAGSVLEKVVAGPTGNRQSHDPPIRVAGGADDGASKCLSSRRAPAQPAIAARPAGRCGRRRETHVARGIRLVQRIHVDRGFLVRMTGLESPRARRPACATGRRIPASARGPSPAARARRRWGWPFRSRRTCLHRESRTSIPRRPQCGRPRPGTPRKRRPRARAPA